MKLFATLGMALLALLTVLGGPRRQLAVGLEPSVPLLNPPLINRHSSIPVPGGPETNSGPASPLLDPPATNAGGMSVPVSGWVATNVPASDAGYSHGITNNALPWAVTNLPPAADPGQRRATIPMVADNWTGQ